MLTLGNDNRRAPSFRQTDIHPTLIPVKVHLTTHRTRPQMLKRPTILDRPGTIHMQAIPFGAIPLDK